ncbi:MAG: hypothetical protein ACN6OU_12815 [Stenotrophomonas acidaminiphila]
MKFINKKVLAVAVLGALASGNALAAAEIQTNNTVFAKEIALPATLTVPTEWKLGYNFNAGEVRYACIKLTGATPVAGTVTPVALDDTTANGGATSTVLSVGSVNTNGNVAFFTLTADGVDAGDPTAAQVVSLAGLQFQVTSYSDTVTGTVGLYDNPAAAGTCGDNQLIPGSGDTEKLISFKKSYAFTVDPNKAVSTVAVDPSYTTFAAAAGVVAAGTGPARLVGGTQLALVPGGILKADGTPIALADIFPVAADLDIDGNFSSDWLAGTTFNAVAPTAIATGEDSANWAINPLTDLTGTQTFEVTADGVGEIPAGIYTAHMTVTPNAGYDLGAGEAEEVTLAPEIDEALVAGDNSVTDTAATAGQIEQDGVKLMTPLVQLAGGNWLARLAISNTGTKDRTFTLKAQGFDSEGESSTVTVNGTNSYVVKAGTTYVFDNLANTLTFNGRARGTVTAIVNAPSEEIKGVYQLVNTAANTISNINMINPSNAAAGGH